MRFSIITITYNAASFLSQTLESVANQEFIDFEHIIWDGGSTDKTLSIAKAYPHVKIFEGKDKGIADAMNKGASFAKGDFLLHLHADDLLAHPKVLSMVDNILKLHPSIEWLYGKAKVIDQKGDKIRITPYEPFSAKRLRKYNFITHPSTFISRQLFNKIGGFQLDLRYCMDYDLWLRLSGFSTPFVVPSVLSCFREHHHSLSTSEPLQVTDEAYQVRNQYIRSFLERLRSYRTWKKRRKQFEVVD